MRVNRTIQCLLLLLALSLWPCALLIESAGLPAAGLHSSKTWRETGSFNVQARVPLRTRWKLGCLLPTFLASVRRSWTGEELITACYAPPLVPTLHFGNKTSAWSLHVATSCNTRVGSALQCIVQCDYPQLSAQFRFGEVCARQLARRYCVAMVFHGS